MRRTLVAALRSNGAQRQRRTEWTHCAGFTSSSSGSTPLHHGFSPGACPVLRRINFGLTLVSWEYTICALGPVDLVYCLDGNHVTAAGDHGTEQVRLADGRQQGASRQQKGTGHVSLSDLWCWWSVDCDVVYLRTQLFGALIIVAYIMKLKLLHYSISIYQLLSSEIWNCHKIYTKSNILDWLH